ncbi:general transcription factor II-I repeat domain-containing protein 2-like [Macrobrachium nipponense]|uniref:general transcription factor II-I repeat domain-containing protein 2-like n=1 Tax=Macrobrachium nipponense TaxID=159736 RepID=UPI0030C7FD93
MIPFTAINKDKYPLNSEKRKHELEKLKVDINIQRDDLRKFLSEDEMVQIATLKCAWIIARRKKCFSDAEMVKEVLISVAELLAFDFNEKEKQKLTQRTLMMPLSRQTATRRIVNLSENIKQQLKTDLNSCLAFSLALDESTDMRDIAYLCIWIRYITDKFVVREELLALTPLKDRTRGCDILEAVKKECTQFELNMEKLSSIATNGAPSMKGKKEGFCALFKANEDIDVPTFHCIIHQESLCCEVWKSGELHQVMQEVIKIVNFLRTRALNHRQFIGYLEHIETEYGDLVYFNAVRWLSRGNVLKRFTALLPDIKTFLELKGSENPNLDDPQWLTRLYFLTDLTSHMNSLNLKLQGKAKMIADLFREIQIFRSKLDMWIEQIQERDLNHFPTLKRLEPDEVIDFGYLEEVRI